MAEKVADLADTPSLLSMTTELKSIVEWGKLNLLMMHMGVEEHEMKKIKNDYSKIDDQKSAAFSRWRQTVYAARWTHIIKALREIEENALASKLEKKYQWKEPRSQNLRTYIQTHGSDELIKVVKVPEHICKIHLKKPATSKNGWYQIVSEKPARSKFRPIKEIQDDIRERLCTFFAQIDQDENKDQFRIGYEARFGRQYQELQLGSERYPACSVKEYIPDLIELNEKTFHPEIYHDTDPILEKYCNKTEKCRQIIVIDPFKFVLEGQEAGLYIAVIEEVKHGMFILKAVYRQPKDQRNSAAFDIVLPGHRYDIRIGDNCGPLIPVTRETLSYRVAYDIVMSMKRKRKDESQLSLIVRGETSKKESSFFVRFFRQKVQTQYRWKNNNRWVLAKYEVDTFRDVYNAKDAKKKFPEPECDLTFHPEEHRVELELWNEKIYPEDVDKTRPTRDEYWYMQSCKTPLFLPGEGEPVPPRPWTTDELMKDFEEFLQAAFDVAECLETSAPLTKVKTPAKLLD